MYFFVSTKVSETSNRFTSIIEELELCKQKINEEQTKIHDDLKIIQDDFDYIQRLTKKIEDKDFIGTTLSFNYDEYLTPEKEIKYINRYDDKNVDNIDIIINEYSLLLNSKNEELLTSLNKITIEFETLNRKIKIVNEYAKKWDLKNSKNEIAISP